MSPATVYSSNVPPPETPRSWPGTATPSRGSTRGFQKADHRFEKWGQNGHCVWGDGEGTVEQTKCQFGENEHAQNAEGALNFSFQRCFGGVLGVLRSPEQHETASLRRNMRLISAKQYFQVTQLPASRVKLYSSQEPHAGRTDAFQPGARDAFRRLAE